MLKLAVKPFVLISFFTPAICLAGSGSDLYKQASALFAPIPEVMPGSEGDSIDLISLGKKLYNEKLLSVNGQQSCNSCHRVNGGGPGVDNEITSPGALGEPGERNSPTVWNAGFHIAQFWDGRAEDLVEQAKGPILNPIEMGLHSEQDAIDKLIAAGYKPEFKAVFPNKSHPLTYQNIVEAIAAFERTLITKDRFDDYLKGDSNALTNDEKQGLRTFIDTGCSACHNGPLLGGHMYQKLGLVHAYSNTHDLGRYKLTNKDFDKFVFKVPSLRDVSRTAPYFHDGKSPNLDEAVRAMAWLQLGKKLDQNTVESIVTFLKALENKKTEG